MSVVEDTLKIIFTVEGAKAISDLGKIKSEVTGLGTASSKSKPLLSNVGGVLATVGKVALTATVAATGFAVALGVSAVKAAAEAEAEMTIFRNTLKNAANQMGLNEEGFAKLDATAKQLSASMSKLGFDDEMAYGAFARLVTVTKDTETAQKAVAAAADLARVKHIDLDTAARILTLGFQGNLKGLKDLGVEIPKNATDMEILAAVNATAAGTATKYADTFPGLIDRLGEWRKNLLEAAGKNGMKALTEALKEFVERLESIDLEAFTQKVADAFEDIQKKVEDFQKPLIAVWDYLKNNIIPIFVELFEKIIKPMVIPAIELTITNFKELWKELNLNNDEIEVLAAFAKSTAIVLTFILAVAIDAVFAAINLLIGVIRVVTALFKDFVSQITGARDALLKLIIDVQNLISWMGKIPSKITTTVSTIEKKISGKAAGGIASGWTLVGEQGPELVNFPGGSRVYNNSDTKNMMGGATVNIYNPSVRNDNDIQSIIDQVKAALGRQTELSRMGAI